MVSQYPDSITVRIYTAPTQNSTTLQWTEGSYTDHTFSCRAESNSSGRKVSGADGALLEYAYAIYMPLTTVVIPPNSEFTLTSDRLGTVSGKVKWSANGQLNSRIWL